MREEKPDCQAIEQFKTKETRLILQSGIYIYFYQYFGRHGLPSSGSSYNEEVNNLTLQFEN